MADGVTMTLSGLSELTAALRTMPQAVQTRVLKGAVATAASVIRKEAIARAPQYTGDVADGHPPAGTLKKAIYQTRLVRECTPTREVWLVSVRKGNKFRNAGRKTSKFGPTQGQNLDAYYATWIEFGHYTRAPKSAGKGIAARRRAMSSGSVLIAGAHWVLPQPFMRPAFETQKTYAVSAMQQYLYEKFPDALGGQTILKWKK